MISNVSYDVLHMQEFYPRATSPDLKYIGSLQEEGTS